MCVANDLNTETIGKETERSKELAKISCQLEILT